LILSFIAIILSIIESQVLLLLLALTLLDRTSWGAIGDRRRGQALFELSFGANSYLCCIEPALFSRALPRGCINLLMVSWIKDKRAIPIYCQLLPKLGSSNLSEQKTIISKILPLLKDYKVVVLGDRE